MNPLELHKLSNSFVRAHQIITDLERQIFQGLGYLELYQTHNIRLSDFEDLHTIFIPGKFNQHRNIYLGHGFGGTSLAYFHSLEQLRQKGNVILWQLRGMGLNNKPTTYNISDPEISEFYAEGFEKVLEHYNHKNIILLNHSFSAYVAMKSLISKPNNNIDKLILLSPVGITPKQHDKNNRISSLGDCWQTCLNKFGWKYNLTFKSPMRTILSRWKHNLLEKSFKGYNLSGDNLSTMTKIFETLIKLNDGSENLFFRYFEPRVLPKQGQSILEINSKAKFPYRTSIYFGDQDWVDPSGAQQLQKENENVEIKRLDRCDHMIPFSQESMVHVIQQEL